VFNPRQPRDRDGKWAGAIVGRTTSGVLKARLTERSGNIRGRSSGSAAQRAQQKRSDVKKVDQLRERALGGERLRPSEKSLVEYQSPKKIAEARRLRGHSVKPRKEALEAARDRRDPGRARRAVAVNPFTGKNVAIGGRRSLDYAHDPTREEQGNRNITRGSVARAKKPPRPKLAAPAYVGRRRAEP
jgi:hypothetical protein